MWLLEPEVFQKDSLPLMAALDKLGIKYVSCRFGNSYENVLASCGSEPGIFYGSLQFAKLIQKTPGHKIKVFCTLPKYECVYYYPRIGQHLLNSEYVMLPLGDIERRKSWLFKTLGQSSLFFRPSSGYKTFTGLVLSEDELGKELPFWKRQIDPEAIIIAAPAQTVEREWRAVVADGKVIAAGQYKEKNDIVRISTVSDMVLKFAQQVVDTSKYKPDPAWTIDICEVGGELKVVEVGSFSCAGLYAVDCEKIVSEIYGRLV